MKRNQFSHTWKLMTPAFLLLVLFVLILSGLFFRWDGGVMWLIILLLVLLVVIQCILVYRSNVALSRLRAFAEKAERNQLQNEDFKAPFPDNDLGEVAQHIIRLYKCLSEAKEALFIEKEKITLEQEEKNKLKRQLTQNIAYELRPPVSRIHNDLDRLINNPDLPRTQLIATLNECHVQSNRLSKLLNDISLLTRLDENSDGFRKKVIDVSSIVRRVIDDSVAALQEQEVRVHNELNRPLPIYGNEGLVYSIFKNLLNNVIAHAGKGVEVWITCYQEDGQFYYFHFSNNGVGLDSRHLSHLFRRFYRAELNQIDGQPGAGLGLSIVKNAVLFHGGNICVRNRREGGLEFEFSFSNVIQE